MYKAKIVYFFEHKEILSGVCLTEDAQRASLLRCNGKQMKLSRNRIIHCLREVVDLAAPRNELTTLMLDKTRYQQKLMAQVPVEELWHQAAGDDSMRELAALAQLVFGSKADSDHEAAVLRAVLEERIHFRMHGKKVRAQTPQQVEKTKRDQAREKQKQQQIEEAAAWLGSVISGNEAACPNREIYLDYLKSYVVFNKESTHYQTVTEILKKACVPDRKACYDVLVGSGVWDEDENLLLQKHAIPCMWSDKVESYVNSLEQVDILSLPDGALRDDLTAVKTFSVDESFTRDIDDAISLEKTGPNLCLGIHIADVASYILPDSLLDREAAARSKTLYFPEGKVPMIPQALSENMLSLKEGEKRPAISFLVTLTETGEIIDCTAHMSVVCVDKKMTYEEVDAEIEKAALFTDMYTLATHLRRRRIQAGAVSMLIPELFVWVDKDKNITTRMRDKESKSQVLVSECMILANYCASRIFTEKQFPALYRAQPKPLKEIRPLDNPTLFQLHQQRRSFSRIDISIEPAPHTSLGLESYVSITSPLRKYLDLVAQRQLVSMLRKNIPVYGNKDLTDIAAAAQSRLTRAALVEQERKRYWILKLLERNVGGRRPAVVLDRRFGRCSLLITEYMLDVSLKVARDKELAPGDTVTLSIDAVDPFDGTLKVSFVE